MPERLYRRSRSGTPEPLELTLGALESLARARN